MKSMKVLALTSLMASVGLMTACNEDSSNPIDPGTGGSIACVTDGFVNETISENCELPADSTFSLSGLTFVESGVTLTIGAGVTIKGDASGALTALVVKRGGKLVAEGTAAKPIVFTSGRSAAARGDFGGVVILGAADINGTTEETDIEGLTGVPYGGTNNADSSGSLKYVRIEYAGKIVGLDNELNGLTMGGVGSKTKLSYIQVFEGLDDCYEWFGGAVSADHLVALGCDDDIFDWDQGWSGSLQFAFGAHNGLATSSDPNGIEADNRNNLEETLPRSNPKVANLTLVGNGTTSLNGIRLRRGTAGHIVNAIVTGFPLGRAVRIDGNTSIRLVNNDSLKGEAIYAYNNGSRVNVSPVAGLTDSVATRAAAIAKVEGWLLSDSASLGLSLSVWKPATAPTGAVAVPTGLQTATYIGAFDPNAATLWTAGWTRGY